MWAGAALAISAPPQEPFLRGFRRMFSISDCQCHAGMLSQAPAGFCSLYQNPSPSHNSSQPHFPSSRQNLEQVKPQPGWFAVGSLCPQCPPFLLGNRCALQHFTGHIHPLCSWPSHQVLHNPPLTFWSPVPQAIFASLQHLLSCASQK